MRPVQLEMAGFAAFREPAVVDFAGADYFALVGPTGSGKSTVIDALTFALYGSVPRWDDARSVSLALAPTVGRGTVRLVFDVRGGSGAGGRYVVARELRRAASGSVSVRNARLERLRDPSGLGTVDDEVEPIADGAGATTAAVEKLLGLPFGDFCTCVVLPQGAFAEFLHAEPRKRQEKLVRILGLGVYDVIAKEANSEASVQRQRAELLAEQLGGYADATAEAEVSAQARVAELDALAERAAATVTRLRVALTARDDAAQEGARIRAEQDLLRAVRAPAGLSELAARRAAAVAATATAEVAVAAADAEDATAHAALAAAPARGPLEQAVRHHTELAAALAELPGAQERREKAAAGFALAARDAADSLAALDAARATLTTATGAHATADGLAQRLRAERAALRALAAPAGLDALRGKESAAAVALASAFAAVESAEAAEVAARADTAGVVPHAVLERARRDLAELVATEREHTAALDRLTAAREAADRGTEAVEQARAHREHAVARHAAAVRSGLAATLRSALVAGDDCPVCAQQVTVPPLTDRASGSGPDHVSRSGPDSESDVEAVAAAAVEAADTAYERMRAAETAAAAGVVRAAAAVERAEAVATRLRAGLAAALPGVPDVPTLGEIDAATAITQQHETRVTAAVAAIRRARAAHGRATTDLDAVRAEVARAGAALRSARDPLVPLGAPVAGDDPFTGWTALLGWAADAAVERERALPGADTEAGRAEQERFVAEEALRLAERAARGHRAAETTAARAEQEAAAVATAVERRIATLRDALHGAPEQATGQAELARITELERVASDAAARLRTARREQRLADTVAADVERAAAAGRTALRAARDPLVPLGAPHVDDDDLAAAWAGLLSWAAGAAAERAARLVDAESATAAAVAQVASVEQRLAAELAEHGVGLPPGRPETVAPTAVAAAVERARAARDRLVERRATATTLAAQKDAAEQAHQVAKMLGGLLRSDAFPRWLVASALDALVADASSSLSELSGGQFELTHDNGKFFVVDHADADMPRPVKTLSGGETFQASLALALALSSQMSGLAADGAARLESIVLDEGFGTLDEANLDIVAGTLENLASKGDRMVGVITHVPALAERVPVRFRVSRDQRTSSVVRESL